MTPYMYLPVIASLLLAQFGSAIPQHGNHARRMNLESLHASYDYIVVGGGTSGLVLANRLSEDPEKTVLVVEYGDFADPIETGVPLFTTFGLSRYMYNMTSVPQRHLNNRTAHLLLGAVVGGGSSVNGLAWGRGSATDYDFWGELGNPGWGWTTMLKYFRKSSSFKPPSAEYVERYGYEWSPKAYGHGPVQVGFPSWQWPAAELQARAWSHDLRAPVLIDGADGDNVGLAWVPQDSGGPSATRSSSERAYYDPASHRQNLHLLVRHYGAAVRFRGKATTGVEIASRDKHHVSKLVRSQSVILAAGTVNTPRILQLSGIGPRKLLECHGIGVVVDSPGVGANFQDHLRLSMMYKCLLPVIVVNDTKINPSLVQDATFYNAAWDEYVANRTGPFSHAWGNHIVFSSLQDLDASYQEIADSLGDQEALQHLPPVYAENKSLLKGFLKQRELMQTRFRSARAGVVETAFGGATTFAVAMVKPVSRGTIHISGTNPDPSIPPFIDFNANSNPVDMAITVLAVKKAREFMASESVAVLQPLELSPGPAVTGPSEIETALRQSLLSPTFSHPVGTAAMMPREWGGVVDAGLRVYGVQGLWVGDASIMPVLPAAHTQATVYAVAEYAADLIKSPPEEQAWQT